MFYVWWLSIKISCFPEIMVNVQCSFEIYRVPKKYKNGQFIQNEILDCKVKNHAFLDFWRSVQTWYAKTTLTPLTAWSNFKNFIQLQFTLSSQFTNLKKSITCFVIILLDFDLLLSLQENVTEVLYSTSHVSRHVSYPPKKKDFLYCEVKAIKQYHTNPLFIHSVTII